MSSCSQHSAYSVPVLFQTESDDLKKVEETANKALKNIQSLYNEIMTPKSYSDSDDDFGIDSPSTSTPISSVQRNSPKHIRDCKSKRRSDLCSSCQKYISYCSSCHNQTRNRGLNTIIQNNLLEPNIFRNEASPKFHITVPQPFSLSAENDKRKEAKAAKIAKLKEELEKESERELNVRIRSQPVPKSIHLPLYEEMTKRNEKRKQERKEKCLEILERETKPFHLSASSKTNQSKSTNDLTKDYTHFKAKPAPKNILSENVSKRIRDKEELRKILIAHRAEEMLKQSSLPFSPKTIPRSQSMCNLTSGKNRNKIPKPDIDAITKRLYTIKCKETMDSWNNKVLEQNMDGDKSCHLKHKKVTNDCIKSKLLPDFTLPFYNFPVRMSTAALLREKQIRSELSLIKKREEKNEIIKEEIARKKKEFIKNIWPRLKSVEPIIDSNKEIEEKVKSFRDSQKTREHEYERELEEMMQRVSKQYLLIERQSKGKKEEKEVIVAKNEEDYLEKQSSKEEDSDEQSFIEEDSPNQTSKKEEASEVLSSNEDQTEQSDEIGSPSENSDK